MDFMKTQLMTFMMMKTMTPGQGASDSGNGGMFSMVYIFLATAIIDFLCKTLAPEILNRVNEYYRANKKKLMEIGPIQKKGDREKTSSITIQIRISDLTNLYGHALLDFITNNKNTKHVSYKKQNFIINQTDIIEIADDIFIKLQDNKTTEGGTDDKTPLDIEQVVELFSYTLCTHELRMFLNKLVYDYELKMKNKLGDNIYYFNQHPTNLPADSNGQKDYSKLPNTCAFTMKKFQTNRKFSNLFGPEIDVVKKRVEFFIKNKKWYDAKGIPYTLGLLLSGQAGAGKTSTVKCLANETRRHIININLNNDISKSQFENLFFNEVINVINISTGQNEKYSIPLEQRIYVLEDIDCQGDLVIERALRTTRPSVKKDPENILPESIKTNPSKPDTYQNQPLFAGAEKLDLSFLLNILDGVLENPGRIVIMTSNYIDQLDHALIRPGRIDIIADFKKCRNETLVQMMEFFYDIVLEEEEKEQIFYLTEFMISPAEMGKIMFENFDSHKEAIIKLMQFVQEKSHIDDIYRTNSHSNVGFTESESQEDYSYKLLPLENRERLEIVKIEKEEKTSVSEIEKEEKKSVSEIEKEEKTSENDCPIDETVKPIKNPSNPPLFHECVKPIKNLPPFHTPIGIDTPIPYAKPYVDSANPYVDYNPNNSEQTIENILPENILPARLKLTNYSCETIVPANLFDYRTNYSKTSDGILPSNLFDYRTN